MQVFIVSFELRRKKPEEYAPFFQALEKRDGDHLLWARLSETSYAVVRSPTETKSALDVLATELAPLVHDDDTLVIVSASQGWWARSTSRTANWLRKHC